MSDDAKDEKKDAKHGDAKPAETGKKPASPLVPIIAAAVVLAGVGVGAGMYVKKIFTPAPADKPAAGTEGAEADPHADPHADPKEAAGGGLLATGQELDPISIKGNITGSGGTRYLTVDAGIWVPKADHGKLNEPSIRRLIQSRLEETVKTYQLEDLQSPNIIPRMKKDFATAVERLLRSVNPGRKPEDKFVLEVTVTNLLTQ
jgi:hypothetical protein